MGKCREVIAERSLWTLGRELFARLLLNIRIGCQFYMRKCSGPSTWAWGKISGFMASISWRFRRPNFLDWWRNEMSVNKLIKQENEFWNKVIHVEKIVAEQLKRGLKWLHFWFLSLIYAPLGICENLEGGINFSMKNQPKIVILNSIKRARRAKANN